MGTRIAWRSLRLMTDAPYRGRSRQTLSRGSARPSLLASRLGGQSYMGLTGFDISICVRACDPSCSDSLNGAKNRIANEQFALAA